MLHDIDVRDGMVYASYWNDGLVMLDIGSGIKGGSPSNPQLVSQYKYDLDALYKPVEAVGGPGYIRGTHTAWRHGKYVFIADEVFTMKDIMALETKGASRAYGRLQVLDVSDILHRSVAFYEPEMGGVHASGWRATHCTWARTMQASARLIFPVSSAATSAQQRDCQRQSVRSGLHSQHDDVGCGGEERLRTSMTSTRGCSSCGSSPKHRSFRDPCHPDASDASGDPL
jgi:hypothetical protein